VELFLRFLSVPNTYDSADFAFLLYVRAQNPKASHLTASRNIDFEKAQRLCKNIFGAGVHLKLQGEILVKVQRFIMDVRDTSTCLLIGHVGIFGKGSFMLTRENFLYA
jgi:hypothetical protein